MFGLIDWEKMPADQSAGILGIKSSIYYAKNYANYINLKQFEPIL